MFERIFFIAFLIENRQVDIARRKMLHFMVGFKAFLLRFLVRRIPKMLLLYFISISLSQNIAKRNILQYL